MDSLWLWIIFNVFVLLMLALDLGVFHRGAKTISLKEATIWSVLWVVVALAFNASMLAWYPGQLPATGTPEWEALPQSVRAIAEPQAALRSLRWMRATEFFFGYLIERALSIDNIFVFLVVFNYFRVEPRYQYRVLYWGILGALIMRGAMIAVGVALIRQFEWLLYVFGAFLLWTGWKLLTHQAGDVHPEHNPVLKWVRKYVPVTKDYEGQRFFVRESGILRATPMFLVLIVVETTDLAFALDSIPAIFGVTQDAFIIYSSNVFAILGLRALYFLLAGAMPYFRYLNHGLAIVLMFIGLKMLVEYWVHIPILLALGIVALVLLVAVVASLVAAKRENALAMAQKVPTSDLDKLVDELASPDPLVRQAAALELYRVGADRAQAAVRPWAADKDLARLISGPPTVGIAVTPQHFAAIHAAWPGAGGALRLAEVPSDQDAREFELHIEFDGATALLDILTPRDAADPHSQGDRGAIARFLGKQGEGVQQVEFPCKDVARAAELIRQRFGVQPVYPETRAGADGTRVNFFLVALPDGSRILIELFERAPRSSD